MQIKTTLNFHYTRGEDKIDHKLFISIKDVFSALERSRDFLSLDNHIYTPFKYILCFAQYNHLEDLFSHAGL